MNAATTPVTTETPPAGTVLPTSLHPASEPLLVPVDPRDLRPTPPPPPRTAMVPAVRVGVAVAALGGVILLAAIFVAPWYGLREITIKPPLQTQMQAQGGGGGNGSGSGSGNPQPVSSFQTRRLTQEVREQGAVTWASSRYEKRTIAAVGLVLAAQACALMSLVSLHWWRPFVSLSAMLAAALPAVALADLLNITNVIKRRWFSMSAVTTNPQSITIPDLLVADAQPGLGMNVLFIGAGVVVLGALIALIGGRRSRVLAQMPKHP